MSDLCLVPDEPTPQMVEAFKAAWHQADTQGLEGRRVELGLLAVLTLIKRGAADPEHEDRVSEQIVGTIVGLRRMPNSDDGNPAWAFRLSLDNGEATRLLFTRKNSSCAFLLSNNSEGSRIRATLSGFRSVSEVELLR